MRKGMGHTAVSTIKVSSVTLQISNMEPKRITEICSFQQGSRYKDKYYLNGIKYINISKKMNLNR